MSLVFNSFVLGEKNISMNLNLFLSFLHSHLKLILFVFQGVNSIGCSSQSIFYFFYLELHDVMLDQDFFFFLCDSVKILKSHVIL